MAATAHYLRGGSKAYMDINCPAAAELRSKLPPQPAGPAAIKGNAIHDACEYGLIKGLAGQDLLGMTWRSHVMTQEIIDEHITPYFDCVDDMTEEADWFEVEVFMTDPELDDCGGTGDVVYYTEKTKTLGIIDLKTGRIQISAKNNDALTFYAWQAKHHFGLPVEHVQMTICQSGVVRTHTITGAQLDLWREQYVEAYHSNVPHPGDHCTWCPAKPTCPAVIGKVQKLALWKDMNLAEALELAQVAKGYIKDVEAAAHDAMMDGLNITGWKVVETRPTRKWALDDAEILTYLAEAGLDLDAAAPRKVITPPQAEKLLGSVEDAMVKKVSSGTTIALETDKRVALNSAGPRDLSDLTNLIIETGK